MKKLIPAVCMLLIAAAMLGTSTFAWFSMNTKVSVTGMQITAKVGNNMFVANTSGTGDDTMPDSSAYKTQSIWELEKLLEPTSSINGQNGSYFYTDKQNVKNDGSSINKVYVGYTAHSDTAFNANYGVSGAQGYVDYVVAIKSNNTSNKDFFLNLSKAKLTYANTTTVPDAFRMALLVQDVTASDGSEAETDVVTRTILRPTGAEYFNTAYTIAIGTDATDNIATGVYSYAFGAATLYAADATVAASTVFYKNYEDSKMNTPVSVNIVTEIAPYWDGTNYVLFDDTETDDAAGITLEDASKVYAYTIAGNTIYADKADAGTATAWYFDSKKEIAITNVTVNTEAAAYTSEGAVKSASTIAPVENLDQLAVIGIVPANTIKFYKITARLWIEGEDKDCNNDVFANLTKEWALDLDFELESSITASGSIHGATNKLTTESVTPPMYTLAAFNATAPTETKEISGETFYVYQTVDSSTVICSKDDKLTLDSRVYKLTGSGFTDIYEITYGIFYSVSAATMTVADTADTDNASYFKVTSSAGTLTYESYDIYKTESDDVAAGDQLYYKVGSGDAARFFKLDNVTVIA